jgi:hypothetical protein
VIQFEPEVDRELMEETLAFAERQVRRVSEAHPGFYPNYTEGGSGSPGIARHRIGATVFFPA